MNDNRPTSRFAAFGVESCILEVIQFDAPVDELKVRSGKLTAKVGRFWHIVPIRPSEEKK